MSWSLTQRPQLYDWEGLLPIVRSTLQFLNLHAMGQV